MYEVDPEFAPDKLVKGRLYRFKARNFFLGVWNGEYGFIGIREKFYSHYLFTEWHADPPFGGTVFGIENFEPITDAPEGLEMREHYDSRCRQCEQPVEFRPDTPGTRAPGRQYHLDSALDVDHDPHGLAYVPMNKPLFQWLAQFEEDAERRDHLLKVTTLPPDEAEALSSEWAQKQQERNKQFWRDQAKE